MKQAAPDPLVTDTTSATQTARARRKVKDRRADEAAVLRKVLGTYEGRQLLWTLISRMGVFEDIDGSNEWIARALGRRAEGLRLMAECGQHRELFRQMQVEADLRADQDRKDAAAAKLAEQKEHDQLEG